MQTNLFYAEPDLVRVETRVLRFRQSPHGLSIATAENIVRAAGGGEPADRGAITIEGIEYAIERVEKAEGHTWLLIGEAPQIDAGTAVTVQVDGDHRQRRRRLHTAVHIAIRSAFNLYPEMEVTEAEIDEDAFGATIGAQVAEATWTDQLVPSFQYVVGAKLEVDALVAKSVESARSQFGGLFRISGRHLLTGKVRLIRIADFDVNPCAGMHAINTGVGPLVLTHRADADHLAIRVDVPRSVLV